MGGGSASEQATPTVTRWVTLVWGADCGWRQCERTGYDAERRISCKDDRCCLTNFQVLGEDDRCSRSKAQVLGKDDRCCRSKAQVLGRMTDAADTEQLRCWGV